jgi:glutathione S-transferase
MDFELYISNVSPYSIKIAALMGYSGIQHEIRIQNAVIRYSVLQRLTGRTMVPVLRSGEWALNDSTEIARYVMDRSTRPTLPRQEGARLLGWLIEDFADEWVVRWMIASRWSEPEDAAVVSEAIGRELTAGSPVGARWVGRQAARLIQNRLRPFGLREENEPALRASAVRTLEALEEIFSKSPRYLFEDYPTVADFALFGSLGQYARDPTGRGDLRRFPAVKAYVERIEAMAARPASVEVGQGQSRNLMEVQPLFAEMLGTYWPQLIANHKARDTRGRRDVEAKLLDGTTFVFQVSGYLQKRLEELLRQIDEAYAVRDDLFGEAGLRMEHGLMRRVAELSETENGRDLLERFTHLGLH